MIFEAFPWIGKVMPHLPEGGVCRLHFLQIDPARLDVVPVSPSAWRRVIRCGPGSGRDDGQNDLFRARLDQIVDLGYALVKLGRAIDWRFLERSSAGSGAVYSDHAGHPPLPTRLMAGLSILKHMYDLSDEDLCARAGSRTPVTSCSAARSYRHRS